MHKLEEIKDKMIDKIIDTYKDHPTLVPPVTDYIDTLAHAAKNIAKLCEKKEDDEYSRGMSSTRRIAFDGRSYDPSYDGSYERSHDGEYSERRYAKRDAMGRYSREGGYSRDNGMSDKIEELIERAPDEQTRKDLQRIADRMRG